MKKIIFFIILCLNIPVCFAEEIDVFKLVENGTLEQLQSALNRGAKFNVERNMSDFDEDIFEAPDYWPFDRGETPLHRAAAYNHNPESIKFLIEQGLNVNATAEVGNSASITPLACALWAKNIVAVEELLKNGADPNAWILSHRLNTGKKSKVIFLDRITSFDKNLKIFFQLFNRLGNSRRL